MANFILSSGYNFGKLHTGLIIYLCDLYNENNKEPLQTFLKEFGIIIDNNQLYPKREYENIDLVVFSDYDKKNILFALEMKVDDYEKYVEKYKKYQTEIYPSLLKNEIDDFFYLDKFLFITLGASEYFQKPSNEVTWIKIRDFYNALSKIQNKDIIIKTWIEAIENEIELQELCFKNDKRKINDYRTGLWNLYFLGDLKNSLIKFDKIKTLNATVYAWGSAPDTILNFNHKKNNEYLYSEINNNGLLNIKSNLEKINDKDKKVHVENNKKKLLELFKNYKEKIVEKRESNNYKKSITLLSIDINLIKDMDGYLSYKDNKEKTLKILHELLINFYDLI